MMKDLFAALFAASRSRRESLAIAGAFGAQATVCALLLVWGYSRANAPDVGWAIVSAFLVLQPEFSQSLVIAFSRVAANLIGATAGWGITHVLGTGTAALVVAVIVASLVCGLLRLDLALRTAAVAVVIIMSSREHNLLIGAERFSSVSIGCATGIAIQLLSRPLTRHFQSGPTIQATGKSIEKRTDAGG